MGEGKPILQCNWYWASLSCPMTPHILTFQFYQMCLHHQLLCHHYCSCRKCQGLNLLLLLAKLTSEFLCFLGCSIAQADEQESSAKFHCSPHRWWRDRVSNSKGHHCLYTLIVSVSLTDCISIHRTDVADAVVYAILLFVCFCLLITGSFSTGDIIMQTSREHSSLPEVWAQLLFREVTHSIQAPVALQTPWQTVKQVVQLDLTDSNYMTLC